MSLRTCESEESGFAGTKAHAEEQKAILFFFIKEAPLRNVNAPAVQEVSKSDSAILVDRKQTALDVILEPNN